MEKNLIYTSYNWFWCNSEKQFWNLDKRFKEILINFDNNKMKSNTIDLSPRQFFRNDEIEPWFNFESLDKRSPDALLAFGDQVYWSFNYFSLDFNDDISKRRNEGYFEWNQLKDVQNSTTKADIMSPPNTLIKDEHLIIKAPLIQNQVTKFDPLEKENGFSQISDNDSLCDINLMKILIMILRTIQMSVKTEI